MHAFKYSITKILLVLAFATLVNNLVYAHYACSAHLLATGLAKIEANFIKLNR